MLGRDVIGESRDGGAPRDVGGKRDDALVPLCESREAFGTSGDRDDAHPSPGQPPGDRLTDATGRTGDHRDLLLA
jgi:hypothetical protein